MLANLNRMRNALADWLTKEGWLGDAAFYDIETWRARGEPYLNESLLVLVIDGSTLHTALNFGGDTAEFDDLVESFGFFYELGHSWNLGFYPIEGYDYRPSTGTYAEKLRDARWRTKADKVRRRAGNLCQDCGASGRLDAHHCYYASQREGYEPWEYPLSALRALCRPCHIERARAEIRMRSFMAALTQGQMDQLREALDRAFGFYEPSGVLDALSSLTPRDPELKTFATLLNAVRRID